MAHPRLLSRRTRSLSHRRGFTILELLIVIGILLALGGIVLYNLTGQSEKATKGVQLSQLQMIKKAIGMFRVDMNRVPTEEEGLAALWDKSVIDESAAARWQGPYLESPVVKDQWGNDLKYVIAENSFGFDIVSNGPDGEEGSDDDISLAGGSAAEGDGGTGGSGTGGSGSGTASTSGGNP